MTLFSPPSFAAERLAIDYDYVVGRADELAKKPYEPVADAIPQFLKDLGYDALGDIRFNPMKALWAGDNLPFHIGFVHPGGTEGHRYLVRINEYTESHVQEIPFSVDFFDYGKHEAIRDRISPSLGYAGFNILHPLNQPDRFDQFAVFAGASYFRVIGRDENYGFSARGLAVNTTVDQPEVFPVFREFWLRKPAPGDKTLTVMALLDGPDVTGAYEFLMTPGRETVIEVQATLFFRREVEQVGLMPFSSMFLFGENSLWRPKPDYRSEVHDSDGLSIKIADDRYLWRPLVNPRSGKAVSQWHFDQPVEFALMQRDRRFDNYQDIQAAYHRRASVRVKPKFTGPGNVTLYEFSAESEAIDNIALLWQPDQPPGINQPYLYGYTLCVSSDNPTTRGRVVATRAGAMINDPNLYECVVDFAGAELAELREVEPVAVEIEDDMGGKIRHVVLQKNPINDTWRLFLQFLPPAAGEPRTLRAYLHLDGRPLTETWMYRWPE